MFYELQVIMVRDSSYLSLEPPLMDDLKQPQAGFGFWIGLFLPLGFSEILPRTLQ